MVVSESVLKWVMRLYPPLLIQRIWVVRFEKGYRGVTVKVNKTLLTLNYNKSIFGGTIFSATDPFFPVLFHQYFESRGYQIRVWLHSASIEYKRPAYTDLRFTIALKDEDLQEAETALNNVGKYRRSYPIELTDTTGKPCAYVHSEIYIRNLAFAEAISETDNENDYE